MSLVAQFFVATACAFTPLPRASFAPAAHQSSKAFTHPISVRMAGWNDPYDVRNMDKTKRVKISGKSDFEKTLADQEANETKKLGIALVAFFGVIFVPLLVQLQTL